MNAAFIEQRKADLQKAIDLLLLIPVVATSYCVRKFLQLDTHILSASHSSTSSSSIESTGSLSISSSGRSGTSYQTHPMSLRLTTNQLGITYSKASILQQYTPLVSTTQGASLKNKCPLDYAEMSSSLLTGNINNKIHSDMIRNNNSNNLSICSSIQPIQLISPTPCLGVSLRQKAFLDIETPGNDIIKATDNNEVCQPSSSVIVICPLLAPEWKEKIPEQNHQEHQEPSVGLHRRSESFTSQSGEDTDDEYVSKSVYKDVLLRTMTPLNSAYSGSDSFRKRPTWLGIESASQ